MTSSHSTKLMVAGLVSDGEDDETVIPIIQTIVPVISIQRIIIKHSRSVEYSYAVLGRYIKMLVYDPRYSKFFLGVPGALLVASGLATVFGLTREAIALVLSILGGAFIIRAFDVDKSLASLGRPTPTAFIRIFSAFAGTLIILASIANGLSSIPPEAISPNMGVMEIIKDRVIVGSFVHGTITLLWIGIATILVGALLSNWFKGSITAMSDILRLVVLALLYFPILQFTSVLIERTNPFTLISSLLIGLAITLVAATFLFQYFRNKKGGESTQALIKYHYSVCFDDDNDNNKIIVHHAEDVHKWAYQKLAAWLLRKPFLNIAAFIVFMNVD